MRREKAAEGRRKTLRATRRFLKYAKHLGVRQSSGSLENRDISGDVKNPCLRYHFAATGDGRAAAGGGKWPRRARQTAADKIGLGGMNGEAWRLIANGESD